MTAAELEAIVDVERDPERRAIAMAALTLRRILDPEWTHTVTVKDAKDAVRHETVRKPAGSTVGPRDVLEKRLAELLGQL